MNSKVCPLPKGEGTRDLAPFSLGRRAGDEGNSSFYSATPAILPFSHTAALEHQRLRKAYPRLGSMDLKIAARCFADTARVALTINALLLTRNASDFGQILELRIEDWSKS